jgi:predicted dehydrogenase
MNQPTGRRRFLQVASTAPMLAMPMIRTATAGSTRPSETLIVGIMGMGGRGSNHLETFGAAPGVEIAYVCDVDERRAGQAADAAGRGGKKTAKAVGDFRRILDDKAVDALVVATCNHWHAPAAILACAAGKHVYVEKPCSHNPREGELLVEAARKHNRVVQMGNQRRSWPTIIEAIEQVRSGAIGRPYFAECFYGNTRPATGRGKEVPVPSGLDYELWQGPAPRRPYRDNIHPYKWHWFWHWGNGELGNNGVHMIDVARWGLGVDYPTRVTSSGGRYRYEDDQETPDTHVVSFEFEDRKAITWEGRSCNPVRPGGAKADVVFYGETGALEITGGGYTITDLKGKPVKKGSGRGGDTVHVTNFLASARGEARPNSEIAEGHKSTLLCHLGNIAHRTGRSLRCDPKDGRILDDPQAMNLWSREYAKGWEPRV